MYHKTELRLNIICFKCTHKKTDNLKLDDWNTFLLNWEFIGNSRKFTWLNAYVSKRSLVDQWLRHCGKTGKGDNIELFVHFTVHFFFLPQVVVLDSSVDFMNFLKENVIANHSKKTICLILRGMIILLRNNCSCV